MDLIHIHRIQGYIALASTHKRLQASRMLNVTPSLFNIEAYFYRSILTVYRKFLTAVFCGSYIYKLSLVCLIIIM